jgi:biopolymer transport protein TolR
MAFGSSGGGRPMADINVTPLVDVMLVLMIIFMVTAPLIQRGVDVDLPPANAQPMPADDDVSVLSITKDQKVYLGEAEIPFEELETKIRLNQKLQNDKDLYLHADRNLPYGVVVDVMATLKNAGIENLGMVTDPLAESDD